ncbi:nucleotidyltransferase [Thalassobacillus sp. CUG 92003]|uniref:nucleotidyltransferase n=1 Tax=Thalassobacillus sp. CUG 92003 TaxID=2736641 RepID=UPI0015E6C537|nr:nucleotidyltransferase [Thalassobacillus sp. CUG 92003]
MTDIKEIGHVYRVNEEGHLINESELAKIDHTFRSAIDTVLDICLQALPNDIHSIYVRGSLPRGLGIAGVSDIDLIVLTYSQPEELPLDWERGAEARVKEAYPFVNGIEIVFSSLDNLLDTRRFGIIPFMVKTYSVCVYGENVQQQLPPYQADRALANDHIIHIRSQLHQAASDLTDNEDEAEVEDCCEWIMKMMVRCGLALVMMHEHTYTRDLYPAYTLFAKHYPKKEPEMKTALVYAINPSCQPELLLPFLERFGAWLLAEAENWLNVHNPERVVHLEQNC